MIPVVPYSVVAGSGLHLSPGGSVFLLFVSVYGCNVLSAVVLKDRLLGVGEGAKACL